ncbi:MAG: hypothetical protein COA42_11180 [Alteromonadaceae bacterium]|nr:MAG: hypothetical protein COA42_11180 [Alteromonadaceae bacterium]
MTPERMLQLIRAKGEQVNADGNMIEFSHEKIRLILIFDENADRMRIISPITRIDDLKKGQIEAAMSANFHSVLDARYCLNDDTVWSAFMHPLASLEDSLFLSAIDQVTFANQTFGQDYQSGGLRFNG